MAAAATLHDAVDGVRFAPFPWARGRKRLALFFSRGQRVLHIGCADNLHLEEALFAGEHLHAALEQVAAATLGVDIDETALDRLRAAGVTSVTCADVQTAEGRRLCAEFEPTMILLTEVLEHLDNPGQFLVGVRSLLEETGANLVITVPSAFSRGTRKRATRTSEPVNPDHRCYYSRATLERLLLSSGLTARLWIGYTATPPPSRWAWNDPQWEGFQDIVTRDLPGIDPLPNRRRGNPLVPTWVKRLHFRFAAAGLGRKRPCEYDGILALVEAPVKHKQDDR